MLDYRTADLIGDESVGKPKSMDNGLPEEGFDLALHYVHRGFYLHLFDEVFDGDKQISSLVGC